jgi:hypothetical protein
MNEFGILLQGGVSPWTKDIVLEYKKNFPKAEIKFSTWEKENVSEINCDIIQSKKPLPTSPHESNINFQIVGVQEGLKEMNSKIILKCRSDVFIHNKNIFNIFQLNCPYEKIMTTNIGSFPFEYRISDFCLLGTRKILDEFWHDIPLYDGISPIAPETYMTKNYIVNIKKDKRPWNEIINEYFYLRDYHLDFQIEWEKLTRYEKYGRNLSKLILEEKINME